MCGICGIIDFDGASVHKPIIELMTHALHHRGPDDTGIYVEDSVGLGHARLSIIDLSRAGHQPMTSDDGKIVIVFNGEVYNFQVLRNELEREGITFRSRTDTEVVLSAYIRWGRNSFKMLNGMFAFAIWDTRSSEIHLVRDRFGVKPLYYWVSPSDTLVFGSEIKALLASDLPKREISWAGLNEYLWFGNALGENTLFSDIRRLQPGWCLTVKPDGRELFRYWAIEDVERINPSRQDATKMVADLLENSVKTQLVSDVPVGVFLSGGIDSSAITAFATKHSPNKLKSFSVGFDFDRGVNELPAARYVADYYGTDHHEIRISGHDVEDVITRLVRAHDEPFADAANIPLYLLCEKIQGSVKVVLQGDGGDELFAGYRRYNVLAHDRFWQMASRALLLLGYRQQRGARFLNAVAQSDTAIRMALLLTVDSLQDPPTRIMSKQWQTQLAGHDQFRRYKDLDRRFSRYDPVQKMLYTDLSVVLPDTFLEKVDKATMAQGIEVRVPFLDNELANYVLGLPSNLKVRAFQKKWILRQSLRGIVPDRVLDGKKTGFGVPYEHWLRGPLLQFMKSVLLDSRTTALNMFDDIELERAISQHVSGERNNGFLLWKALNLALWTDKYGITLGQ